MATHYYYLISSLPELRSDGDLPLRYQEFLDMCEPIVGKTTYRLLETLSLHAAEGPLMKEWNEAYGAMTKELNYQRSLKLGKSYPVPEVKDYAASQVVSAALAAGNPLEAEQILLDFSFRQLDQLVGLHMFDDYVLFGYALKLKLLERQKSFNHEKGQAEFRRMLSTVQQRVYSLQQ